MALVSFYNSYPLSDAAMLTFLPLQQGLPITALPDGLDSSGDWSLRNAFFAGGARKGSHEHIAETMVTIFRDCKIRATSDQKLMSEVTDSRKKGDILTYDTGIPRHKAGCLRRYTSAHALSPWRDQAQRNAGC